MQYILTPFSREQPPFAFWQGAFSPQQLDWLQQKARENPVAAQVGSSSGGVVDPGIRRSNINWLFNTEESNWVYDTLGHVVSSLNAQYFNYDLTGFGEPIQLTNYNSKELGMYGWHIDSTSQGPCRKLSLVLQLSDPVDYEGGNLELMTSSAPEKISKQRGLICMFPSWTHHQVTPVTQGNRQSLVLWITGPRFK